MSVPKGKRKESRFEAQHQFFKLRDEVTMLIINDFGFSSEKYLRQIERYKQTHQDGEETIKRWMKKTGSIRQMVHRQRRRCGPGNVATD